MKYQLLQHTAHPASEQNLQTELDLSRCRLCLVHDSRTIGRCTVLVENRVVIQRRRKVALVQDVEEFSTELHTAAFHAGKLGILDQREIKVRETGPEEFIP